jgi:tripartite-type tricarboxylate transporter receptor subunit TctC
MFVDVPTGAPRVLAGQLQAYAVTSEKASPILPEVPTMGEAGMPDFPPNSGWWGLYGPAKVPQAVAMRLSRELQAVMGREDVQKKLLAAGVEPAYLPAEEMEPFLRKQLVDWRAFLKEFKIAAGS